MKEVETDMREAAVRYFEGCLSAQDEERLYRFIQESGGNYSLFKEWERQWLETSVANERTEFEWEKPASKIAYPESGNSDVAARCGGLSGGR